MVVIADISGIQSFLFDVAEEGGGQARRLRARSFVIGLAAEAAALRVLLALGWPTDASCFVSSAAGKFVLQGPGEDGAAGKLMSVREQLTNWLRQEIRGELRLALAWAGGSGVEAYRLAQRELQQAKARPWAPTGVWAPEALVLAPLETPCVLCKHAPATEDEEDRDGGVVRVRRVCRLCARTRLLGRKLPKARRLTIRGDPQGADIELFGLGATVSHARHAPVDGTVAEDDLEHPKRRSLMAYVPHDNDGAPTWFVDIAEKARGDHLLGVLKADADSLGQAIEAVLRANSDLRPFAEFSEKLDAFFAGRLKEEIESGRDPRWRWIYTIFAGGDDLIMVGPWDVMIDFAGRLRELFQTEFQDRGLTISAGVALCKPKRPIKGVAAEADRLLERAKTEPAGSAKDQLACFGQVWKWQDHAAIMEAARRLVGWVDAGQIERGWLHTLLGLVEARHPALFGPGGKERRPDYLATARLAYHVERNYHHPEVRRWAERIVRDFDDPTHVGIRYLPAALRYALTATRGPGEEE